MAGLLLLIRAINAFIWGDEIHTEMYEVMPSRQIRRNIVSGQLA